MIRFVRKANPACRYARVIDDNRETIGYDTTSAGKKLDSSKN